ncbi:neutral/alkaline ceramidase [Antrihabitans stalagmiti]|uniref:neutral/alkaline ceramidase n=1 Tax=Antrihabitans stalagmiti TaxID=2799499 RepID=UPI0027DCF763|nr:neutral/alkaline ceramidase [Antrihabitans stalagmiti]
MTSYSVGRGISDITGEPADAGMLGYGKAEQRSDGIHTRLRARAFVFEHGADRLLLVVCELPLIFDSICNAVLARIATRFGARYTASNTMITATHTHCGPGGYSHHYTYNATTNGYRAKTFDAIVDGAAEAVERADADLTPTTLTLSRGELHNASVNRSRVAFDRNPLHDKTFFPEANDPQVTVLAMEREETTVGAITWFATHNTSMTNTNTLISSDNKGYASYHWERLTENVDYLRDHAPAFVAAFAQTNSGDMSPNLNLKPGSGPTDDEVSNTRIIGLRQFDSATKALTEQTAAVAGGLDSRTLYVTLSGYEVAPEFTGDGKTHHTGAPIPGAAAIAGASADGDGFAGFSENGNPLFDRISRHLIYRLSGSLADSHAPKGLVAPAGSINKVVPMIIERVPVQLFRIGQLYLIGIPGEVTIVAGLRLRRTVAAIVGAELADVLVAGYSNGYIHYVTTPEEYEAQRYEGGSTMFGKWELPALQQIAAQLATAMADGVAVDRGDPAPDLSGRKRRGPARAPADEALPGHDFGDQLTTPAHRYVAGDRVVATFVGAYPNNDLRRGDTYLEVQQQTEGGWARIADDGDFATTYRWKRRGKAGSVVEVAWQIPDDAAAGTYRLRYHGDARDAVGRLSPFTGTSTTFGIE